MVFKIIFLAFDNATNNTAAIELFNRQLKIPVGNDLFHVRCVCHIINLIVKDGIKIFEPQIQKKIEISSYILDILHIDTKNLKTIVKQWLKK